MNSPSLCGVALISKENMENCIASEKAGSEIIIKQYGIDKLQCRLASLKIAESRN